VVAGVAVRTEGTRCASIEIVLIHHDRYLAN
jgi:hypothetical protein